MVFKTITNFIYVLYRFYPVLPMGKTDCFTQFYPILPNWFYPLGKTYMPTLRDRCPCDTPLAASSGTGQLQIVTHGISSTALYGAGVLESTRSGIGSTKSPPPAVVVYTSAARSAIPSDNHRPSLVSCCSIHRLELIVCSPPVFTISLHVPTYLFHQSFPDIVIWHRCTTLPWTSNGYMSF